MKEIKRAVRHFVENPRYLLEDGLGVVAIAVMLAAFMTYTI